VHIFLFELILLVTTVAEFRLSGFHEFIQIRTVRIMAACAHAYIRMARLALELFLVVTVVADARYVL
jgi:hypothetical protein